MMALSLFLLASCLALSPSSDQVTAGDLAPKFPGMESLDAATPLAPAPAPGASRSFHLPELSRLAERFHLATPPAAICVERPVAPLDPDRLLAAMRAALPKAEISILDWSRAPAPTGEITFPSIQLRSGPAGQWWSGYVQYAGTHRFLIWARVSVRVTTAHVVALRDLLAGQPVPAEAVEIETRPVIPGAEAFAETLDEVVGQWPRTLIRAGASVRLSQLAKPLEVMRGDRVRIDAQSGAAHLALEARAEGSGATGDMIPVTNLQSQRRFFARVVGKDRLSVDSSTGAGKP